MDIFNDFPVGLFVMQALILLILIFLMAKFAWKPIMNSLTEREQGIKDALDSAEKAKMDMENLQANNLKMLQEARAEREEMLKEARDMKNKMIEEAKREANETASKLMAQAQANIQSEKKAAIADLKSQVASLSVEIAEKVVRTQLSNKDQQLKLVETMLDEKSLN